MVITYYGQGSIKLQLGDTVIALNPVGKDSTAKAVRFGADIAMISARHADLAGVDQVVYGDKQPFVISGPGEYETKGIFINGLQSSARYGGIEQHNTIYTLTFDGMKVTMLGVLASADLPAALYEEAGESDILFVPVGTGVLSSADANKVAVALSAKIIIPLVFGADSDALKRFLVEAGEKTEEKLPQPLEKLTIKKKDLEGKEGEIVILESHA